MSQPDSENQMDLPNTEFDAYLMVDWCAENQPKKGEDSLWYCLYDRTDDAWTTENPPTRRQATDQIASILHETTKQGKAILTGFDFPFGYPAGFSSALGLRGKPPWRAVRNELKGLITDDDKNRNNRFEAAASFNQRISSQPFPFWGRPQTMTSPWISGKKARPHLAEFRLTEQKTKGAQPVWKLLGKGCVGSQALVGIPCVARLRDDDELSPHSAVWPFETGLTQLPPRTKRKWLILYAEIFFPAVFKAVAGPGEIKDQVQVRKLVERLKAEDERGELGKWFAGPGELSKEDRRKIVSEEGWILGVR
jgi:precorrin-8X/cobalt-precorrin-8 methylmutase